ncbi:TolC family outer membrane protein [Pseudomonas cichorii]|nr:TolC family outer membrane protein [Pseudomonas cichorii]MBX8553266.1 TolC family outer membrane protein [Pseudomonas cichorii]
MIVRIFLYLLAGILVSKADAAAPQATTSETQRLSAKSTINAEEYSVDLMQLYHESRLQDPRILAAYARTQAAKEYQKEAFGALLPQVSANAGSNRIKQSNQLQEEVYNSKNYSIGLSQIIYNKKAWENYQQQKSLINKSLSEEEETHAQATVDLVQRYFSALAADDELVLLEAELQATQKNLDRVNALYKKNYTKITDVLDLKARLDSLTAQEVDAHNQIRLSRAELSEIIGRTITEKLSRVRNDADLKMLDESLENWVQLAQLKNPSIKANLSAVEAAEAGVRAGKGDHYPTLSLNLRAQNTNEGYNNALAPKTDSYVAGIALSVPIYSGGSTSARARALYHDQAAAEQQLELSRRRVVKETTNAYLNVDSTIEKIRANRQALASAEQSSIASNKAFEYGVVNATDVLTSVQNEFKARRELLKTQYDFITNLFVLNQWAGKLPGETIESVNVWLNYKSQP